MAMDLDSYFGIHAKALTLREARTTQLATNLSNVDTPNYKAKDIDFVATLQAAMQNEGQSPMITDNPGHIASQNDFSANTLYRTPSHSSLDGNTVDKDIEITEFTKNAVAYQASLSFLDNKIKSLVMAIRGE